MRLAAILSTACLLLLAVGTASWCADGWEGQCEEAYSRWATSSTALRESMESLRKTRDESLRNDILDAVAKAHPKMTTARIVQSFLEKQNEKIVQATEGCREVADQERFAFDDLKRCVGSNSRRRGSEAQALSALARDRDKVIAELRDLSVEPAYVQYRKDRDPLPPSTSSEPWPRSRASREEQSPWNQRSYYGAPNSYAPRSYYGR